MSLAQTTIADLLVRARGGDQKALDRLFALCRNYVNLVAQAQVETWLRAKVDASDLVQETFLEAYRDFQRFRGATEAEWLVWLRRILERNAADFLRHYAGTAKRQVRREVALREGPASSAFGVFALSDGGESPVEQLLRKERELLIADAVAQLAPDHREVILLRNLERLDFDEVGRRMNRSRPAAQMLWLRALRRLQELLPPDPSNG